MTKKVAKRPSRAKMPSNSIPALTKRASDLIDGDTRKRLDRFCEAHHGADPETVLYKALNDFISNDLNANGGALADYNRQ